jgi:hypothetical protein
MPGDRGQKGPETGGVVRHVSDAMLSEAFRIKRALLDLDKRPRPVEEER